MSEDISQVDSGFEKNPLEGVDYNVEVFEDRVVVNLRVSSYLKLAQDVGAHYMFNVRMFQAFYMRQLFQCTDLRSRVTDQLGEDGVSCSFTLNHLGEGVEIKYIFYKPQETTLEPVETKFLETGEMLAILSRVSTQIERAKRPASIANISLDVEDKLELERSLLDLPQDSVYGNTLDERAVFLKALEEGDSSVMRLLADSNLREVLTDLKGGKRKAVVIEDMPVDLELPETPIDGGIPFDKQTFVSEGLILALCQLLGRAGLMPGEQSEALVHQIAPTPSGADTQSNQGVVVLKMHQDLAPNAAMPDLPYNKFMPDFLILAGLKGNEEASTLTYLSPVQDVVDRLDVAEIEVLMQERFVTNPPDSFLREGMDGSNPPLHSILQRNGDGHWEACFDISSGTRSISPDDEEARLALIKFMEAIEEVKQGLEIKPGMIVAFRNREILHGRGPVEGTSFEEGAQRRWLQRGFAFDYDRFVKEAAKMVVDGRNVVLLEHPGAMALFPNNAQGATETSSQILPKRYRDLLAIGDDVKPGRKIVML